MRYLLIGLIFLVSCSGGKKEELLFVVHASQGTVSDGKLVLDDVDPKVTFFTDRPVRQAGEIDLKNLLQLWDPSFKGGFAKSPPNAGLVFYEDHNEKYREVTVELLKQPVLKNGRLTFDIKDLSDRTLTNQSLTAISLFIDSASTESFHLTAHCVQGARVGTNSQGQAIYHSICTYQLVPTD